MKKIFTKRIYWLVFGLVVLIAIVLRFMPASQVTDSIANADVLLNKSDIVTVKQESINDVVYFTGDLSPKDQTIISAEVDARILKVWVDEGQLVKAGQALADLDTLDLAQAVSQQQAQVAGAKAKLVLDQQKMEKQSELLKQGFVSQIAYDELVSNYQASLQNYKAQEAMLKRSQKQLTNTHITAPFAGIIYQRSVQAGQLAQKNTKLFALANLSYLEIKAAIPSDQINQINLGESVEFKVETDSRVYHGVISRINQVAEAGTRSYMVYIDFNNLSAVLKSGQFIKGQIILRRLDNQLVIPCDAMRSSESSSYVLVLKQNKILSKPVQLILSNRQTGVCSVSGIANGDKVLAGNVLTVKTGDSAKIVD